MSFPASSGCKKTLDKFVCMVMLLFSSILVVIPFVDVYSKLDIYAIFVLSPCIRCPLESQTFKAMLI